MSSAKRPNPRVALWCSGSAPTFRFLFDVELKKPACVLLQSAAKADWTALSRFFSSECWLDAPTPGMRMAEGTAEEWKRIAVKFCSPPNT